MNHEPDDDEALTELDNDALAFLLESISRWMDDGGRVMNAALVREGARRLRDE